MIVAQSKNQLLKRYKEEAATITANCTNWVFFTSRELDLLRELSELCGQKQDQTPNISVYDLQHLSKEKNEALLLYGRLKPCIVNLLDIDNFGERRYFILDFETPIRLTRTVLDFSVLPPGVKEQLSEENKQRLMNLLQQPDMTTRPDRPTPIIPDSIIEKENKLIEAFDKKIEKLDEELAASLMTPPEPAPLPAIDTDDQLNKEAEHTDADSPKTSNESEVV